MRLQTLILKQWTTGVCARKAQEWQNEDTEVPWRSVEAETYDFHTNLLVSGLDLDERRAIIQKVKAYIETAHPELYSSVETTAPHKTDPEQQVVFFPLWKMLDKMPMNDVRTMLSLVDF
jgi:hypothetical protein